MPSLKHQPPRLARKKSNDTGYVTYQNKKIYMGKWGDEADTNYRRFLAEWANGTIVTTTIKESRTRLKTLTIQFLQWSKQKFGKKNRGTQHFHNKNAVQNLLNIYETIYIDEFGPVALKTVRLVMEHNPKYSRQYINQLVGCIKRMFNWGVENELVPVEIAQALHYVKRLSEGESKAREAEPVQNVDLDHVERTLPHLTPTVADMVCFQLLTGARPAEVCQLQFGDIDRTRDIWVYWPSEHKNKHRKKKRFLAMPREARELVERRMMGRSETDYLFTPKESDAERREILSSNRRSKITPSQLARHEMRMRDPKRKFNPCYDTQSYGNAVEYAIKKFNNHLKENEKPIEHWTPYQLRHAAITAVSLELGEEAAQIFAGHANIKTTDIYDHSKLQKAIEIASRNLTVIPKNG